MAVPARDQVARVVHPEPDASETETSRPATIEQRTSSGAAADAPEAAPLADDAAKPKSPMRRRITIGVGAAAALAGIYFGYHYMVVGRYMVTTDDAYVRANNTVMGAKIAGHISKIWWATTPALALAMCCS